MIQFPYGIADFRRIRREGMVYVYRTGHIRDLERLGSLLVFLRPRRFGKSLWVQTLATYYDLLHAAAFDEIFGGLAIHDGPDRDGEGASPGPTPLAHRFFVLQWNFSTVDASGGVREIAASLGVAHILEGSVQKAGERVRVTAQLVRADDGFHVWSDSYDRRLEHIFEIEDEIAGRVANALEVTLGARSGDDEQAFAAARDRLLALVGRGGPRTIDWRRTRAYLYSASSHGIELNLRGRQPEGCVAPEEFIERLKGEKKPQRLERAALDHRAVGAVDEAVELLLDDHPGVPGREGQAVHLRRLRGEYRSHTGRTRRHRHSLRKERPKAP